MPAELPEAARKVPEPKLEVQVPVAGVAGSKLVVQQ